MSTQAVMETTAGLIFKEKKRLVSTDEILSFESEFKNLLRTGESFHRIKKKDVIAVKALDSGFRSLTAIIMGILIAFIGLTMIGMSLLLALLFLMIGGLLLLYGLQKEFLILVEYLARPPVGNVFIPGRLKLNGQGTLPLTSEMASLDILTTNVANDDVLFTYRLKETFLTKELARKTIQIGKETLVIKQEGTFLRPNGFWIIPTKHLIATRVDPSSFKSIKWAIVGILLILIGIMGLTALSSASLLQLLSNILLLGVGLFLAVWGFQRMTKIAFTYMIVGNRVYTIEVEGIPLDPIHMLNYLGDVAMQAAITAAQRGKINNS